MQLGETCFTSCFPSAFSVVIAVAFFFLFDAKKDESVTNLTAFSAIRSGRTFQGERGEGSGGGVGVAGDETDSNGRTCIFFRVWSRGIREAGMWDQPLLHAAFNCSQHLCIKNRVHLSAHITACGWSNWGTEYAANVTAYPFIEKQWNGCRRATGRRCKHWQLVRMGSCTRRSVMPFRSAVSIAPLASVCSSCMFIVRSHSRFMTRLGSFSLMKYETRQGSTCFSSFSPKFGFSNYDLQ